MDRISYDSYKLILRVLVHLEISHFLRGEKKTAGFSLFTINILKKAVNRLVRGFFLAY